MADSNTTPQDRVRIFTRTGSPVAEFRASVERSWSIGDEGRAQFDYPTRKTDVMSDYVIQFGNWVLVENSQLPPWVGVIDVPRSSGVRTATISAYTPEHMFGFRVGPTEQVITGPAGLIYENLIGLMNSAEQTIIRPGNIWQGGAQRQETINPVYLSEVVKRLHEGSGEEYAFRPATDINGSLLIYADWTALLGTDTGILLHEGKGGGNVESAATIMLEDGPVYNEILSYGDGATWQTKPQATVRDETSIGRYGLRQSAQEYSGVTSTTTLQASGAQNLLVTRFTARTFRLNALNVGDTFSYIGIGNMFTLRLENVGFNLGGQGLQTRVRISGMRYDPDIKNKIDLVVQEVINV
jgi:hypothetical protein